jgi:hypothetical protein
MATTTNYGWTTPDDTALVKDGAAAIRTLGSSVDTTTKNLNPSTTLGDIEYRSSTANTNTRLGIGTTGQVLTVAGGVPSWAAGGVSFSGVSLTNSASISCANDTRVTLTFDTETYDTNGFHSTVTNTDRITIPAGKAGKYLITFQSSWPQNATSSRQARIYVNTGFIAEMGAQAYTTFGEPRFSLTTVQSLSEGDYLTARVVQNSGGSADFSFLGAGTFTATFLGA